MTDTGSGSRTIATLGAAYSANKGAAAMMQSLIDNLGEGNRIIAVSTHAADDRAAYRAAGLDIPVVSQAPVEMALVQVPLAFLAGLLRKLRLPYRWLLRPAALRALHDADVVADLSGISFVDGRRFVVIVYNALVTWLPMLLGTPVVKCSQAMGPFKNPVNRALAKLTLPRLARVSPRGPVTEEFVRGLGLKNISPAADLAFSMQVSDATREKFAKRFTELGIDEYVVVSPSQVVQTSCEKQGIDYRGIFAEMIGELHRITGLPIVMVAHSAQPDKGANHLNDLPLCREVAELVGPDAGLVYLDEDLLPTELRAVIAGSEMLVASRFHAMIAALAESVPMLVVGWSHKYGEVLDAFGLGDVAVQYSELTSGKALADRAGEVFADRDEISAKITSALPPVNQASLRNFDVLREELNEVG